MGNVTERIHSFSYWQRRRRQALDVTRGVLYDFWLKMVHCHRTLTPAASAAPPLPTWERGLGGREAMHRVLLALILAQQFGCVIDLTQKIEMDVRRRSRQGAERLANVLGLAGDGNE